MNLIGVTLLHLALVFLLTNVSKAALFTQKRSSTKYMMRLTKTMIRNDKTLDRQVGRKRLHDTAYAFVKTRTQPLDKIFRATKGLSLLLRESTIMKKMHPIFKELITKDPNFLTKTVDFYSTRNPLTQANWSSLKVRRDKWRKKNGDKKQLGGGKNGRRGKNVRRGKKGKNRNGGKIGLFKSGKPKSSEMAKGGEKAEGLFKSGKAKSREMAKGGEKAEAKLPANRESKTNQDSLNEQMKQVTKKLKETEGKTGEKGKKVRNGKKGKKDRKGKKVRNGKKGKKDRKGKVKKRNKKGRKGKKGKKDRKTKGKKRNKKGRKGKRGKKDRKAKGKKRNKKGIDEPMQVEGDKPMISNESFVANKQPEA